MGKHLSKIFSIFYMLNRENRVFNPYFSIGTCPMRKRLLWISQGLNLLSFSYKKKYHFLRNFSPVIFMGNPSLRLSEVPIVCVSCSHKWGAQRHLFLAPPPGARGGGKKGQISLNIIKFQLQSQIQRFLNQTLCVFLQMKDIKNTRLDFLLAAWIMP